MVTGKYVYPNGDQYFGEHHKNTGEKGYGKNPVKGKMIYLNKDEYDGTWRYNKYYTGTKTFANGIGQKYKDGRLI